MAGHNGLLDGRVAIVTGGGAGFGAGIARAFAREGARVIVADRDIAAARAVANDVGGLAVQVDVTSAAEIAEMTRTALESFGTIDILVNNAGTAHVAQPLEELSEEAFDRLTNVNMKSIYLTSRSVVPHFKAAGSGVILNIASASGLRPRPNLAWYAASKGWVVTATKAMAIELAPHGIRVNAICPAVGDTQLFRDLLGDGGEQLRAQMAATIPLGHMITPEDIGNAACYLCSAAASSVTGVDMPVDGGRCI